MVTIIVNYLKHMIFIKLEHTIVRLNQLSILVFPSAAPTLGWYIVLFLPIAL